MPIYEYRCDACNTVFEEWHRHADDITEVPCPKCHTMAHRLISNTSFVLKGGGWYVTEYGNRKEGASPNGSASGSADVSPGAAPDASPSASTGTGDSAASPASATKPETAPAAAPSDTPPPTPAARTEKVAAAS